MRRILAAVRSAAPLVPDILLIAGWIVVAIGIRDADPVLLWLGGVPFAIGLGVNADAYRRAK